MPMREDTQDEAVLQSAPLGGTRAEAIQRLQIGFSGLAAMVLLVGLANIIQDRARVNEELAVPDAAPTTEPAPPPLQRDPLADAGVVPDLPAEAASAGGQGAANLPATESQRPDADPTP